MRHERREHVRRVVAGLLELKLDVIGIVRRR